MKTSQYDQLNAASFCKDQFPRIDAGKTVREAAEILAATGQNLTLLVTDHKNRAIGALSCEGLLQYLLEDGVGSFDNGRLPDNLQSRLGSKLSGLRLEPLVWVEEDDPLPILLLRARQDCSEWLAVRSANETDTVRGLVYLSDLYQSSATLALGSEKSALPFTRTDTPAAAVAASVSKKRKKS